jgi:hypothetical protein
VDVAIRTAYDLGDIAAVRELLAMIDDCPPRHLAPRLLSERALARARLADRDGSAAADPAFAALGALRVHSTLTSLAHCLLDHVGYLTRLGEVEAAETAISQAREVARAPALPATAGPGRRPDARGTADRGPMVTAPGPEESATARHR